MELAESGYKYTAVAHMSCRKQQICWACGAVFSFVQQRTISATADTEQEARSEALRRVRLVLGAELDNHPCPDCGRWQPEREIGRRSGDQDAAILLAVLGALTAAGAWGADFVDGRTAILTSLAVTCAIPLAWVWRRGPRRSPARNAAAAAVRAGVLRLDRAGAASTVLPPMPQHHRAILVSEETEPAVTRVDRSFQQVS